MLKIEKDKKNNNNTEISMDRSAAEFCNLYM